MEQITSQIVISLTGVIATLVAVIVILNKRLGNGNTDRLCDEVGKEKDERKAHCADQLEKCQAEFKSIAVNNASIEVKLEGIIDDLKELKSLIKNGNKQEVK